LDKTTFLGPLPHPSDKESPVCLLSSDGERLPISNGRRNSEIDIRRNSDIDDEQLHGTEEIDEKIRRNRNNRQSDCNTAEDCARGLSCIYGRCLDRTAFLGPLPHPSGKESPVCLLSSDGECLPISNGRRNSDIDIRRNSDIDDEQLDGTEEIDENTRRNRNNRQNDCNSSDDCPHGLSCIYGRCFCLLSSDGECLPLLYIDGEQPDGIDEIEENTRQYEKTKVPMCMGKIAGKYGCYTKVTNKRKRQRRDRRNMSFYTYYKPGEEVRRRP
jgi:hypothetical protein